MITVKTLLKKNKKNRSGKIPIYLRITKSRRHAFLYTKIKILPENWDKDRNRVKRKAPLATRLNTILSNMENKAELIALKYEEGKIAYTAKQIKEDFQNGGERNIIPIFKEWMEERLASKEISYGTYLRYKSVYEKFSNYFNKKIGIKDFNETQLQKFKTHLSRALGNGKNTVSSNLSCLRAFANYLVHERLIKMDDNPFIRLKLQFEDAKRSFLNPVQLQEIEDLALKADTNISYSRDIFIFCSQTGLRIGDALHLKKKHFDGERITFLSQKTKTPTSLLLTKKARNIINEFTANLVDKDFIFPFLHPDKHMSDKAILFDQKASTSLINKNLKIIGERCNLGHISSHIARHSMATNAITKGLSFEEIKALLNHRDVKTTQLYAKVVDKVKDDAIRKLEE